MASIKNVERLLRRCVLSEFLGKKGLAITPLVVGQHGIGKSQIVHTTAKKLGGNCLVVEGSAIGEKELTGLPMGMENPGVVSSSDMKDLPILLAKRLASEKDDTVRYIKHYIIKSTYNIERELFKRATTSGFLNGSIKVLLKDNGEKVLSVDGKETVISSAYDQLVEGDENFYKFGEFLDPKTKFKLLESGEVKPLIIFIDEINRTEVMIQKELMNIILNKNVSGYNLPWFVSIVAAINPCSQNSSYATNEMDPAQLDRFLKIKADANIDEWVDYALSAGIDTDTIEAIAVSEQIFMQKDSSLEDQTEMTPSPRGWEIVAHIKSTKDFVNNTRFFSQEERDKVEDDFRVLVRGKVGDTAGRTYIENLSRKDSTIKPEEFLTLKSTTIEPKVMEKFQGLKRLTQKIMADNLANYIIKKVGDMKKLKNSSKPGDKETYANWKGQIKDFTVNLDPTTQQLFVTKFLEADRTVFAEVASYFSTAVLQQVIGAKDALRKLSSEE